MWQADGVSEPVRCVFPIKSRCWEVPRVAGRQRVGALALRVSHQVPLLRGTRGCRQTAGRSRLSEAVNLSTETPSGGAGNPLAARLHANSSFRRQASGRESIPSKPPSMEGAARECLAALGWQEGSGLGSGLGEPLLPTAEGDERASDAVRFLTSS